MRAVPEKYGPYSAFFTYLYYLRDQLNETLAAQVLTDEALTCWKNDNKESFVDFIFIRFVHSAHFKQAMSSSYKLLEQPIFEVQW